MKIVALLASLLYVGNAFAGELTNFEMLKNAAMQGKKISIVLDGSKCSFLPTDHDHEFYSSFTPNHVDIEHDLSGKQIISTSANYVTSRMDRTFTVNAEFSITPDNKVNASITYFDYTSRFPVTARAMECSLTSGVHIYIA